MHNLQMKCLTVPRLVGGDRFWSNEYRARLDNHLLVGTYFMCVCQMTIVLSSRLLVFSAS